MENKVVSEYLSPEMSVVEVDPGDLVAASGHAGDFTWESMHDDNDEFLYH